MYLWLNYTTDTCFSSVVQLAYFIPRTGLDWTRGLNWKQLLNNNPGIIHLLQQWRHHYQTTTAAAGSSLQVMTLAHALIN